MNIQNKIYVVNVYEYNGIIGSSEGFCMRNKIIENNITYTLKDAIDFGKTTIREYSYNEIYKMYQKKN